MQRIKGDYFFQASLDQRGKGGNVLLPRDLDIIDAAFYKIDGIAPILGACAACCIFK